MPELKDREHFIPLRKQELIDHLCGDAGLTPEDADGFRRLSRMVSAVTHFEFHQRLEELKTAYAPFDPDPDTRPLERPRAEEREQRLNRLFRDFAWLMDRANFVHLSRNDLEPYLGASNEWGLRLDVDFSCFERLAIFARGDTALTRTRRRYWLRTETVTVPVFRRLVLILKLRAHRRLSDLTDTDSVYIKFFKDIPKIDLSMLLPGARAHMGLVDRGKVTFPLLTGFGLIVYKILYPLLAGIQEVIHQLFDASWNPTLAFWGVVSGFLGYGYRSYYGYTDTKRRYRLAMTHNLYFQNLDNNRGVLVRLLDEAEEQECREALLAYFFLWRQAGPQGWTPAELDERVEGYLRDTAGVTVDFETAEALDKLEGLGLVRRSGGRCRAVPLAGALEALGRTWDCCIPHNGAAAPSRPVSA